VGRHERRRDLVRFKREARSGSGNAQTFCFDVRMPLGEPQALLRDAARFWRANMRNRRCLGCRTRFSDEVKVGGYFMARPDAAPTAVSVSGFCEGCWLSRPDEQLQRDALRILRELVGPEARFAP
jgi:hypothetical protein